MEKTTLLFFFKFLTTSDNPLLLFYQYNIYNFLGQKIMYKNSDTTR